MHLTARGRKLAEQALAVVIEADGAFLEPLTTERQAELTADLRLLLAPHEH